MLTVQAKTKLDFEFNGYKFNLKPGEKLLFANDVFNLLPKKIQTNFEKTNSALPPFYEGEDLNGKTLFVFMQGAIGDVLCSTVALREVKKRYPECKLWVSVSGKARPILENLPYIDKLLPHPAPVKEIVKANYMVKAVEMVNAPHFDHLNLVEWFLWKFRLYFAEDETPDVWVDQAVVEEMKKVFEEIKKVSGKNKVLLFHYLASSVHRTLPPRLLKEIEDLISEEFVPVICSLPDEDLTVEVALDLYGIKAANLSAFMQDIRYLVASVYLADAVITADTSTLHIAGGLKKPTVFITGPIEAKLRADTYKTVIPVQPNYTGKICKSPCGLHATNEPCAEAKSNHQFYSPCIESIPPKVIYFALKDALLAYQKDFEKPKNCPLCGFNGPFSLFEVINQHRIFECPSCGLQFPYPPKAMDYDKAYEKEVEDLLSFGSIDYDWAKQVEKDEIKERKKWERVPRFNVLLPILEVLPKGRLLDVGCSSGNFMLIARAKGFDVYGMDASDKAVELARKNYKLKVVKALTFKDLPPDFQGPYKVITAFEIIEHLEEPFVFLKELYELLEDGGFAILSCPPYFAFRYLANSYLKYQWWGHDYPPHHLNRFKPWTLYYGLKLAGFEEVVVFTEPLITGTVLEGINPQSVEVETEDNQKIILSSDLIKNLILENLKPLYLNARYLGNFQYAIGVKGKSGIDWEKILQRAIRISAVDIMWKDDKR
ncbi:methyltransferase domain-containing protein [Thermodesulfobacterium sp. TA1]|uniref:methyltransferase domain-containing protein n=1 Tax=Thermodesulfobacterium sp. TA1 TaxID=2234087 RepID=UPI001231BF55|nr:methyltransferase domain-containing protein [Thermodesulfobacterium sp. TA1]QER41742.1 methyltransferase domain-containing protein [Thermodesulfobacterium sp. TA1]